MKITIFDLEHDTLRHLAAKVANTDQVRLNAHERELILQMFERVEHHSDRYLIAGIYRLDRLTKTIAKGNPNTVLPLTPAEYRIAEYLMVNAGRIVSAEAVSGFHVGSRDIDSRASCVVLSSLRRKGFEVRNRSGFGYYIETSGKFMSEGVEQ